jgi:hypothetical protein
MTQQYVFETFDANVEPLIAQSVALVAANIVNQINQVSDSILDLEVSVADQFGQLIGNVIPGLNTLEEITLSLDNDPALAANLKILIAAVQTNLSSEVVRATNAEQSLQSNIANEATARIAVDASLQTNLNTEITRATAAELSLQSNINAEITARTAADNSLQANIVAERTARTNADANLQTQIVDILSNFDANIVDSFSEVVSSIGTERSARIAADTSLQANITTEVSRATAA